MRIAIVSTPRSGNMWVRGVLRDVMGLEEFAVHDYRDLPPDLPERAIVQLHWYREPGFQSFLRDGGFKVVVLGRHPLDVLVSVLHYCKREPLTARWLQGNAEIPDDLPSQTPSSAGFERYALSWGAENLLSVSYQWWFDTAAIRVRYEDLVVDPATAFAALIMSMGASCENLSDALAANAIAVLRKTANQHGWQGSPGLWRQLIPPLTARRIQRRHARLFQTLGYHVPLYGLTRRQAERAWLRLST